MPHGTTGTPGISALAPFATWPLSASVMVPLLIAAMCFGRGVMQMRAKSTGSQHVRYWTFHGGLVAIFLALQTPLDVISEHVFAVHQLQHLLLRGIAPMLLMLAAPAGPFIAGVPQALRRMLLAPLLTDKTVRAVFGFLTRPLVATLIYIGTLYVWQMPVYQNRALFDESLHYLMHVTMLLSGLLFFSPVFDPRPAPWGVSFNKRLVMLGVAIFANIPLGAIITLKATVLYTAYDQRGRWWGIVPLSDEQVGGLIIWVLASMMGLLAVLLLMGRWHQSETKLDERRRRGFTISPGNATLANLAGEVATSVTRRRFGLGLACVPLMVFTGVIVMAVWLTRHTRTSLRLAAVDTPPISTTSHPLTMDTGGVSSITRAGRVLGQIK